MIFPPYQTTCFFIPLVAPCTPLLYSQNISKDRFQFIPKESWTEEWNDEKLYQKYSLTDEEISFIESMIKPIEVGGDGNGN